MKRIYALLLILLINFINIAPMMAEKSFAEEPEVLSTEIEDVKVYLVPKSLFELEFESDFDANEASENDDIYFRLLSPVKASNGKLLPEHTRMQGHVKKIVKSQPMFKRARAYILVDKIILPNEKEYKVRMESKNGSNLKSPQILNILRAFPAGIGIISFSIISVATVAIESVTIVGLVVVPRTCKGFGLLISSMAKGLNYKVKAGSKITFKLDTPVYVSEDDLK